jgi:pSer/pThr/pTyr-binding forkhead associated (FHA) protein
MYIRDVKSSNGTFVNGERLSNEGMESEPYELKSEDIVVCLISLAYCSRRLLIARCQEFGIDIVSEDNKTVQHYKVSAKAYVVWNVDDAGWSAR